MVTTTYQGRRSKKEKFSHIFLNQYYTQVFDIKGNGTIVAVGDKPGEGGDVIGKPDEARYISKLKII